MPLRRRLFGDRAVVTVNGRPFVINLKDKRFSARLYYRGPHEPEEVALLARLLQPGMTVLDVGANIGLHTVEASAAVGPEGRVIAFEPDPVNCSLLTENCARNECMNVTIEGRAVAAEKGETRLYQSLVNFGDHRIYDGHDDDRYNDSFRRDSILVSVTTLDDYVAAHDLRVDFVKCDIQGAEYQLWRGMQHVLADRPDLQLLMEFWPYGIRKCGDDPATLLGELRNAGFILYSLDGDRLRTRGTDELLAALPDEHFVNLLCAHTPPAGVT